MDEPEFEHITGIVHRIRRQHVSHQLVVTTEFRYQELKLKTVIARLSSFPKMALKTDCESIQFLTILMKLKSKSTVDIVPDIRIRSMVKVTIAIT